MDTIKGIPGNAKRIAKIAIPGIATVIASHGEVVAQNISKTKEPTIVYNEDDPKLKAFKDSSSLVKNYLEVTEALKKQNYIKRNVSLDAVDWGKTKQQVKDLGVAKKQDKTLYVTPDFIPGVVNKTLPDQLFSDSIDPLGVEIYDAPNNLGSDDPRFQDVRYVASYKNVKPKIQVLHEKGFTSDVSGYPTIKIQYDKQGKPVWYKNTKGEKIPYDANSPSYKFTKEFAYPDFEPFKKPKIEDKNSSKEDIKK